MFNKIARVESRYPWSFWLIYYCIFLLSIALFSLGYTHLLINLHPTDVNSARYLLSALIQSQASIIAIVITLTLVAIQITVSNYSPRVVAIFLKSPHMYLIFLFYVFSIGFEIITLQSISGNDGVISQNLEYLVSYSIWLTIFLAISLLPYLRNTLDGLNPEKIALGLIKKIDKKFIISSEARNNYLEPIFDIIHIAINRYDLPVVKNCLKDLSEEIIESISVSNLPVENSSIIKIYTQHLRHCAQLAIDVNDEEILLDILANFHKILIYTVKITDDISSNEIIDKIDQIHTLSLDADFRKSLRKIITILDTVSKGTTDDLGKIYTGDNPPFRKANYSLTSCLEKIGKETIDKMDEWQKSDPYFKIFDYTIWILKKISNYAVSKKNWLAINDSIRRIYGIGKHALDSNQIEYAGWCASNILSIWKDAIELGVEIFNLPNTEEIYLACLVTQYYHEHPPKPYESYSSYSYETLLIKIGLNAEKRGLTRSRNFVVFTMLPEFKKIEPVNLKIEFEKVLREADETDERILLEIKAAIFPPG